MTIPPLDESALLTLIEQPETDSLEFKRKLLANSQISDYVVGMGNAGGGFLIFGISDKLPREIFGIDEPSVETLQKMRRSIYDSTRVRVELETVKLVNKFVLAVRIPARPKGSVLHTSDGKFLIRVGSDLVGLTPSEIASILREAKDDDNSTDSRISLRFNTVKYGHRNPSHAETTRSLDDTSAMSTGLRD